MESLERQYERLVKEIQDLIWETKKENPNVSLDVFAKKVQERWQQRPENTDSIHLIAVNPVKEVKVQFYFQGKHKEIKIEL